MWNKIKQTDYRHYICAALLLGALALGIFVYQYPWLRLIEAVDDLWRSIAYSFADLFGAADRLPFAQTVNSFSRVDLNHHVGIDVAEIVRRLTGLKDQIFVWQNFFMYVIWLLWWLTRILMRLCWVLIAILLIAIPMILTWDDINNDHNADTRPLRWWKRWVARPFRYARDWCIDFWDFFRSSSWWTACKYLTLLHLGLFTVAIEFVAYYLWLLTAFDFATVKTQLIKLVVDVILAYKALPVICWTGIAIWLYDRWRIKHGTNKLYHLDARNKGLAKELPMCNYIVGLMRSGKDMLANDMALTFGALDRQTNLEILNENMKRFPRFPWILLELELKEQIMCCTVRSWTTARSWWSARYLSVGHRQPDKLWWGYDTEIYPTTWDDGLKIITLYDSIEEYVQAYFSYTLVTSYMVSVAPVRDDFIIRDEGNLVLIDTDYLDRGPEDIKECSQYSHVIDWDMFRLGRKIRDNNPNIGAFEFGILVLTEIDKERKNMDQLKEVKAREEECNQKNDLFNTWAKMAGHGAMLGNRCLLHVLTNAQRPTSWGADGHELCAGIHIEKHKDNSNALPLWWIEEGIIGKYLSFWDGVYDESRLRWGNHHLITWLGQGLASILYGYLTRRNNRYGYYAQKMLIETGTIPEQRNVEEKEYFVIFRKAYAERYASDFFRTFSTHQTESCTVGLNQLPTYRGKYPTLRELDAANSHLVRDLFGYHDIRFPRPQPSYDQTDENLSPEDFNYYTEIRPAHQQLANALQAVLDQRKRKR